MSFMLLHSCFLSHCVSECYAWIFAFQSFFYLFFFFFVDIRHTYPFSKLEKWHFAFNEMYRKAMFLFFSLFWVIDSDRPLLSSFSVAWCIFLVFHYVQTLLKVRKGVYYYRRQILKTGQYCYVFC